MENRAYTLTDDGLYAIDMKIVSWKMKQSRRSVKVDLQAQARNETTETLKRVVSDCAGTMLAKFAADELIRRSA